MSPFEYLQFGVCFVSFIFEQMSSFNVDSTYGTDVMIHWKRFFPRKWKENGKKIMIYRMYDHFDMIEQ